MAKTVTAKPVFTEEELRKKHIGEYEAAINLTNHVSKDRWKTKREAYEAEGVLLNYIALVDSFKILLTDYRGIPWASKSHEIAQTMMDRWLHLRLKGEVGMPPKAVVLVEAIAAGEESATLDPKDWEGKKKITENEAIRWLFENIDAAGLKTTDSPSMGVWAWLLRLRKNKQQSGDFFKTIWAKLLTKEDGEKGSKLQDTGKTAIELNERLIAALPEDPERGLLQEIQANGFVVSEEIAERIEGLEL